MPRAGLDTETVVNAAAKLADKKGLDQVTFAALAAHFKVAAPSLYNHVPGGLDGLRAALARLGAAQLSDALVQSVVGRSGPAAVHALAEAYQAFVRAHPGLYAGLVRAPDAKDKVLVATSATIVKTCARVLEPFGLSGDDALHAVRGLRALVHGFSSLESGGGFGMPLDLDESFRRLVETFVAGLQRPVAKG